MRIISGTFITKVHYTNVKQVQSTIEYRGISSGCLTPGFRAVKTGHTGFRDPGVSLYIAQGALVQAAG